MDFMFRRKKQPGFSLIEIMVVLLVISVLASLLLAIGRRIHKQAQEKLAKSQIGIIVTAVEQYHEFYDEFPLVTSLVNTLAAYHSVAAADIQIPGTYPGYYNCEALFFILDKYPDSRRIIENMSPTLLSSKDVSGIERGYTINDDPDTYTSLVRFIDPWGQTIQYQYVEGSNTFPLIYSAGPDSVFGTDDDISSNDI